MKRKPGPSVSKIIEGLSHTRDQNNEAIACLHQSYHQPRVIHQSYVKTLVECPHMHNNGDKELRWFDVV